MKNKCITLFSRLAWFFICALISALASANNCKVEYDINNQWQGGAQIQLSIHNVGVSSIDGYNLRWQLGPGESFASGWNANFSHSEQQITANNPGDSWNGYIAPGAKVSFGFILNSQGNAAVITEFLLNGERCTTQQLPSPSPSLRPSPTPSVSPSISPSPSPSPSPSSPGSAITAQAAANAMGKGFNLGQMFESEQHAPTFASAKAKIDAYYALGHRNVRIPITWTESLHGSSLLSDSNNGDINLAHPHLHEISATIDYALSLPGLFVVINAHHEKQLKDNEDAAMLARLWQNITELYLDREHRLIYELLNEPHKSTGANEAMPAAALRNMSAAAYNNIRALDPERIIIIGGNRWFNAHEMAETWPHLDQVGKGRDKYLMATFHHYNPWSFHGNHQGDFNDNWNDSHIYSPMDTMIEWANNVGNGMPIYIGEWGTGWGSRYQKMQCNNIRHWYQKFDAQYASLKGQPTAVWDDGGWFKIFDHSSQTFANNLHLCIDRFCEWQGSGQRFNSGCD
ncbi:cellulase family glycosylhydrolase [Agaribacterium haliotis]|uniref:cellulase family glycosylhydrolase n=1 Tax=Agaribacterium haliotis TaxID=2013869 RepID=UPI000BB5625E|nr:cellulase family glycosylhydrolase [Agaribacterium haliotis]